MNFLFEPWFFFSPMIQTTLHLPKAHWQSPMSLPFPLPFFFSAEGLPAPPSSESLHCGDRSIALPDRGRELVSLLFFLLDEVIFKIQSVSLLLPVSPHEDDSPPPQHQLSKERRFLPSP